MINYTNEKRQEIIRQFQNGKSAIDLIDEYNFPISTFYYWLKLYKVRVDKKNNSITYFDYAETVRKLKLKNLELEIYENLHCFKDSSTKEKEVAISKFVGIYPIKTMCRILDLPSGTFYNYHLRRTQVTQYQIRDEQLKQEIYRIFKESGERFGAKKIEAKLRTNGINMTLNKIQTLMKLLNIKSSQQILKKGLKKECDSQYYVNKLKRLFNQDAPNKYWVSDVTEVKVGKNKFYLCVILDLFSRKVIAYRLSSQNNTQLTINTFKDAFENRNRPKELSFHSDQGSNYTAYEFRDLLRLLRVNQSFSHSGNPYDNACMESFFSSFKREEYNAKQYEYIDELEASVDLYMEYYNNYRPHQTLKNKIPSEFEADYFNNFMQ